MKRSAGIIAVFILFAVAGGVLLTAGLFDRRMAIAQEDMAVLDFAGPAEEYAALEQDLEKYSWVSAGSLKEIQRRKATLQYWQRDYADLVEVARTANQSDDESAIDPEMQVLAANALFRIAQRGPQDRPTLIANLDAVIRAYADAMRAGSERPDVAFNYELAVRIRQEVGAGKRKAMSSSKGDDPATDPNMHGDPGEPPKDMKVEQFKIRIPMDPQEMKQSQEKAAGTGAQRRRRG